jgi:gluconokinase
MKTRVLLLMGVSGSGKSTIGSLLSRRLGWPYADADTFHSAANLAKMASGHALTDADREPWLQSIRAWIDERVSKGEHGIVSCSALKRSYRDSLRRPEVTMVYLRGTRAQIEPRLRGRRGHFFKPELLNSQFLTLEEPSPEEHVITVSIDRSPAEIADAILTAAELET